MARYKIIEGSESAHCCFEATVVDTEQPWTCGEETRYETICECFNKADAELICDALNAKGETA